MASTNIIDKIKSLINLSMDKSASIGEAQNATATAAKLIDKYRITEDELSSSSKEETIIDQVPLMSFEKRTYWRYRLAHDIAKFYGCFTFDKKQFAEQHSVRRSYLTTIIIAGKPSDIAIVRYMLGYIMQQIEIYVDIEAPAPIHNKAYRGAWSTGAVEGVLFKIAAERKALHTEFTLTSNSVQNAALTVLENRSDEVENFVRKSLSLSSAPGMKTNALSNRDAIASGFDRGRQLDTTHKQTSKLLK